MVAYRKANRLEIYEQTADGLSLAHSKAVYGKVTILHGIRPALSATDHLVVATDRFMYFVLSWDAESRQLKTEKSYVGLADKSLRDSQTGDRCHLEPNGRFMTLELFEGVITAIPIHQASKKRTNDDRVGTLGDPAQLRISELFVRSSAFSYRRMPNVQKPRMAILFEDSHAKVRLKVLEVESKGELAISEEEFPEREVDLGASHIIPIPGPACELKLHKLVLTMTYPYSDGLLILGETSITYVADEDGDDDILTRPLEEATVFVAWERIDPQRYVLADDYGRLYLLMLVINEYNAVEEWRVDVIGQTSRPSVLVYLDAGHIFVGSHQGDSQVVKITEKSLEIVQTFMNIAPILDFTIMDMGDRSTEGQSHEYSSGQARLVTGSGAFNDGSLRSVRSGVGMEELGVLGEMDHITDIFSLTSHLMSDQVDTLAVSFINETRFFRFSSSGDAEELEDFAGFSSSESTLLAMNQMNGRLIQVTSSFVRMTDSESGMIISDWTPSRDASITAVAGTEENVVVSIGGLELLVLDIADGIRVRSRRTFDADVQIACVTVPTVVEGICVVGFWKDSTISILKLDGLGSIYTEKVAEALSVPRSLLLAPVLSGQPPTLFVALADGNVVTFAMDPLSFQLSGRESIVLGTQQAKFKALPREDGLYNTFVTCDHPSLIYGSEGRLTYSAITAEDATCVCPFDSEYYPGAIAIATADDLKIALVDTKRTTHVQTLSMHETVRRIAYSPKLKAFGLGTIKRTLKQGVEIVQSHFKLVDEVVFKELDTYALNEEELVESVVRAELDSGDGTLAERFIVGTAYLDYDMPDSVRGRLLVLEVTEDRHLKVVAELAIKGACRCLAVLEGKIVAALIKTVGLLVPLETLYLTEQVVIYSFTYNTPSTPFLAKVAAFRTSTAPVDLSISGRNIAVADLMKSVSILQYNPGVEGTPDTLEEIARHYQTSWATAVAEVDDSTYLESDAEGNLMVLYRETNGVTEADRMRLRVNSDMLLGEMVNRIRRINTPTPANAVIIPRAFVGTVSSPCAATKSAIRVCFYRVSAQL